MNSAATPASRADRPFEFAVFAAMIAGACTFLNVYCTQPLLPFFQNLFHATEVQVSLTVGAVTLSVAIMAPIIGLLAEGVAPPDIAAGVQNAIAQRVAGLAGRSVTPPVCFTGGVALQSGMVRALETALSCAVQVSPLPQYTGALGAAILAGRQAGARPLL